MRVGDDRYGMGTLGSRGEEEIKGNVKRTVVYWRCRALAAASATVSDVDESKESQPLTIRAGQKYRARQDFEVIAMTHWNTAFTGGHRVTLPAGEIFRIAFDPPEGATAAACVPEHYDALHERFIPAEDREHPKYSNYSLSVSLQDIRERAELLPK